MTKKEFLKEEYNNLKNEIEENSKITSNLFIANVTITATLIGLGLSASTKGLILLTPFIVLIPSVLFIVSKLESTTRISSYLRIFIESEFDGGWHTHWFQLRDKKLLPTSRKYTASITLLYFSLFSITGIVSGMYWDLKSISFIIVISPIVCASLLSLFFLQRSFSKTLRRQYNKAWLKLKSDFQKTKP